MEQTPFRPTIRTQADLETTWRHLMRPLGFSKKSLWLMLIEPDGLAVPNLLEITDTAQPPDPDQRGQLATFLRSLADDVAPAGSRAAFLLSRPGDAAVAAGDRAWATALYDACREAGLPCEIVHLATDTDIRPLPLDELGLPASA